MPTKEPRITLNITFELTLYQACKIVYYVSYLSASDELPKDTDEFLAILEQFIKQNGSTDSHYEVNHFTDDPAMESKVNQFFEKIQSWGLRPGYKWRYEEHDTYHAKVTTK